jgi:hypothetical protein
MSKNSKAFGSAVGRTNSGAKGYAARRSGSIADTLAH